MRMLKHFRHWVVVIFVILLSVDFGLAIYWCFTLEGYLEPIITAIALLATIVGLAIDRWLTTQEQRGELLKLVIYELFQNRHLFSQGAYIAEPVADLMKHYTRQQTCDMDAALASGLFNGEYDADLFKHLQLT
jgi:hypothetical protein